MKYARREDLPHRVRAIENEWIELADGIRLAVRLWLPEGAEQVPVPAILEYIPYRKRDGTRRRDERMHPYLASYGYVCARVDMRGSGDSEGVLTDEYLEQEQADCLEVLRWLAARPWCDGAVGMLGISWGGFNGLQVAALAPAELKAVVSVASTDDRYADDVHYMGGCLLGDNLSWASTMFAYNSLPPDPALVGDRWREMWLERLDHSGLWVDTWLRHQRRDDYWKHGSINENFAAVKCPVLLASGWADGYTNAVFRMLEQLRVPRLGLVGPWSHKYPQEGVPGPAIGFLQECVRFYDRWLKGQDNGVMDAPMLRAWMQFSVPPTTSYSTRPGRWVAERTWPTDRVQPLRFALGFRRLLGEGSPVEATEMHIQSPLSVGLFAGKWCSYSATPDLPHDQREEDGGALAFDSDPIQRDLELLGSPVAELELSADQPIAMVAVRLSDVLPDGKATRVTYGILNLTHRNSDEHPEPLTPGQRYRVRVQMNDIAQQIPKGHRIRLSVSTSYFPLAWPSPTPVCLTLDCGASALELPVRVPMNAEDALVSFGPAESLAPGPVRRIEASEHNWLVVRDLAKDRSTLRVVKDEGIVYFKDIDWRVQDRTVEEYSYVSDDFESARGEVRRTAGFARGDWEVSTRTRTVLSCTEHSFVIYAELDAFENDRRMLSYNWERRIDRDLL